MSNKRDDYYIGLDCGTNSVGWAVTDQNYNLLRAKGKTLWGSRLFDAGNTAAERRTARSSRRRTRRTSERIKLLNLLFQDEMAKIDPEFYLRLTKSFLLEEDKHLKQNSKNTLFNDSNFKDKDFHKQYPTIWHLRKAIIEAPDQTHFDLRLYYLAIHHILKNRGHFLRSEKKIQGAGDFSPIFQDFCEIAEKFDFYIDEQSEAKLKSIVSDRTLSKNDKKRQIKESIFIEADEPDKRLIELSGLLVGSTITPLRLFEEEVDKDAAKLSFSDSNIEEKFAEIEGVLDSEQFSLIEIAKKIYDYGYLNDLLSGEEFISSAMVKNYESHQKQLKELKQLLKPFQEDYQTFFKTKKISSEKTICYNAYIGKAYTENKSGRKSTFRVSQEDLNKEIEKLLEKHHIDTPLLEEAKNRRLLPKQKGQAKGTIPQQLHHEELLLILSHLEKDYPSFAKEVPNESKEYNTLTKKIASIHSFRIPYYCGPINKNSDWSWADEEIAELVRPWNFKEIVKLDTHADKFIRRMTNKCTYLPSEDVLPKSSLLYQKYMVLNELNNLKINGVRIDNPTKQIIYEKVFENGEIPGNITIKNLTKWLRENGHLGSNDELSGFAESTTSNVSSSKFLPKLSTHLDFLKILGQDYQKRFSKDELETVINLITILNNEPEMLRKKISDILGKKCSEDCIKKLAHKSYKGWARFSDTFLTKLTIEYNGKKATIIDMLWESNQNLMELLSSKYHFKEAVEDFNQLKNPPKTEITYQDVANLYCSPSVKRTIWQSIKIIDELVSVEGSAPAKIFIESTREDEEQNKNKTNLKRKDRLMALYKELPKSNDTQALLDELESKENRDLQSKKFYLYFSQMGHCAYCGERINLDELTSSSYDIDHIYPRSKTKDDSITRNLVLVDAKCNREKADVYPIKEEWRKKMRALWFAWRRAELITKDKYDRLVRTTPLTAEELSKFISRQIVETSQSAKALRDLLAQKYPKTKIVLVKAGQVSNIRNYFANGYKDKETNAVIVPGKPEFVKVRALNDLHHAKDAYLNIVVGNVMSETFTDNPYKWLKNPENFNNYSINSHNIWRSKPPKNNFIKGWNFANSIKIISHNMSRNNILWTRMPHYQTGAITDLQPVGKSKDAEDLFPLKKNLDPTKYGGYNSIKGSHFALIEQKDKKSNLCRKLVQIPILAKENPEKYIHNKYENSTIIIPTILMGSLFKINNNFLQLNGRTGDSIIFAPAHQLYLAPEHAAYLKKVCNLNAKIAKNKNYIIDEEHDQISQEENVKIYDILTERLKIFETIPELGPRVSQFQKYRNEFMKLSIEKQCEMLEKILVAFGCNSTTANLSDFIPSSSSVGKCRISNNISNLDNIFLVHQSPTGLFERKINLKTCPPQTSKES